MGGRNSARLTRIYCDAYFGYLPCIEGSRDRGKPVEFNKDIDNTGLCNCRGYNWRRQNEVVKAKFIVKGGWSIDFYYCIVPCWMTRRSECPGQ